MTSDIDITRQDAAAITDPRTGELVERSDTEKVAEVYQYIQGIMSEWGDARAWCCRALIEAADQRNEWTFTTEGGVSLEIDPPSASTIDWDLDELHKLEDLLPPDVYGELVVQTVSEKAKTQKLQTLARRRGADSDIAKIISQAERRRPRARAVRVKQ